MAKREIFSVSTSRKTEMVDITDQVQAGVPGSGVTDGTVVVFVPHTTAGVTINEGADPAVQTDIIATLNEIVPWERGYQHAEGNSPAHIKSSMMGSSVTVILENGRLSLGTWQRIFFCEFDGPRRRQVWCTVVSG
jgi:secondary thiamine-phosphate synthase enzyme